MFGTMRRGTGSRRHSRHGQMIEEEEEKEFKYAPNYFIKNYFYTAQQGKEMFFNLHACNT